jgi:predicted transcriptional regulator
MRKKVTAKPAAPHMLNFLIDEPLHNEVRQAAKEEDRTVSSLIRRAIREYLSKQGGQRVEART